MKRLFIATILFLFPFSAHAGFPEVENGYDLKKIEESFSCLLYTSPSPRDAESSRMPSSA